MNIYINNEYKTMGNSFNNSINHDKLHFKHGTINYFKNEQDVVIVTIDYNHYELKKDNPEFLNLYHKLKPGLTYKFFLDGFLLQNIVDIVKCSKYEIDINVWGFLNIKHENNIMVSCNNRDFDKCEEIFFENKTNKRFMMNVNDKKGIIVGLTYKFTYEKAFGENFYLVTDYKLID